MSQNIQWDEDMWRTDIQMKGAELFISAIRRVNVFRFLIKAKLIEIFKVLEQVADFGFLSCNLIL